MILIFAITAIIIAFLRHYIAILLPLLPLIHWYFSLLFYSYFITPLASWYCHYASFDFRLRHCYMPLATDFHYVIFMPLLLLPHIFIAIIITTNNILLIDWYSLILRHNTLSLLILLTLITPCWLLHYAGFHAHAAIFAMLLLIASLPHYLRHYIGWYSHAIDAFHYYIIAIIIMLIFFIDIIDTDIINIINITPLLTLLLLLIRWLIDYACWCRAAAMMPLSPLAFAPLPLHFRLMNIMLHFSCWYCHYYYWLLSAITDFRWCHCRFRHMISLPLSFSLRLFAYAFHYAFISLLTLRHWLFRLLLIIYFRYDWLLRWYCHFLFAFLMPLAIGCHWWLLSLLILLDYFQLIIVITVIDYWPFHDFAIADAIAAAIDIDADTIVFFFFFFAICWCHYADD